MKSHFEFCRKTLADEARDLYLISLMARGRYQPHLWALFAFAHELAKTRYVVTEPTLGLIRLQWWRDELSKHYEGKPVAASEVLHSLQKAISTAKLNQSDFDALITAREDEFRKDETPKTPLQIIDYLESLNAPLIKMAAQICGDDVPSDTIGTIARNRGIVDVLYRAKPNSIVGQNKQVFIDAFEQRSTAPGCVSKAFIAHSQLHFRHLKSADFEVEAKILKKPPMFEALRLWLAANFGN